MSWEVQLTGASTELRMLADTFTGGEIQIAQSGQEYVLRSAQFELLDSATSVRQCAIELVTALSSSVRLMLGAREAIGVGAAVYRVGPDGKRGATFVLIGHVVSHERVLPLTVVHGTQSHRPADPISAWLPLIRPDSVVAEALRLRDADALDWVDLYRLYEVIESDVGHLMRQLGWASQNELKRFTRTANSVAAVGDKARHGVEQSDPPPKPMSLAHARALIDRVLRAWLEWKASHDDQGGAT